MTRLYLSPPDVGAGEREALVGALDSGWIAPLGPSVDAFERDLAGRVGVSAALATSSGTAALHLALLVAGVQAGDEVAVPTLTFAATANAVSYIGARPVFVDADPATWNIDPGLVSELLAARARSGRPLRALISVDLYGQCADYAVLEPACQRYDATLVEDAAEALGASFEGRAAGSFGTMSALSFNGNKIITTSGGGMLLSDDEALIAHARKLATQAREPVEYYQHTEIGFNYRLSNLLAALGCAQLAALDQKVTRRRAIYQRYREALSDLPGVSLPAGDERCHSTHWLTVILIDPTQAAADRETVRRELERVDIEARSAWKPMHLQPVYQHAEVIGGSVAERVFAHGLCLPSGSAMLDADQHRVIETLRGVLDR